MNWLIGSWLVMTCLLSWHGHALADITPIDNIIPELAEIEEKAKALEEKEAAAKQDVVEEVKKAPEKPVEPAPVVAQAAPAKPKVKPKKKKPPVVTATPTPAVEPPVVAVKPFVARKPPKPVEAPVDPWLVQERQYSFP